MNNKLPESRLLSLSLFVKDNMGLNFEKKAWKELEAGAVKASDELGFNSTEEYLNKLLVQPNNKEYVETLAAYLTIGETYFFRENQTYHALEEKIIPDILKKRRGKDQRLRIWSAGCCSGEEPYSIAMMLNKMIPDLENWKITILGTDINPHFLKRAEKGVYTQWSFRTISPVFKEKYFYQDEKNKYHISGDVKGMVDFSPVNLAVDHFPSLNNNTNAMDIIFCRNVLMYFEESQRNKVINKFYASLVDGGYLIVGNAELSHFIYNRFRPVNFPGTMFYQKSSDWEASDRPINLKTGIESFDNHVKEDLFERPKFHFKVEEIKEEKKESNETNARGEELTIKINYLDEAERLYKAGRYEDAFQILIGLSSEYRENEETDILIARIEANRGNLKNAIEYCRKAINKNKLEASYYYLTATILQEMGEPEEAMASLKRALFLNGSFVLAHIALGNLSAANGKKRESLKHYDNALKLLKDYNYDEQVPESDGMTAGRLVDIVNTSKNRISLNMLNQAI